MANVTYEANFVAPKSIRATSLVNYSAAAASFALIVGLGYWGYELVVRDVSGIPVVRAAEGPLRIAPTNPGGEVSANTGLSVNHISAKGEAAPSEDALLLAPQNPVIEPGDLVTPVLPEEPETTITASFSADDFDEILVSDGGTLLPQATEAGATEQIIPVSVDQAQILALVEQITSDESDATPRVIADESDDLLSEVIPASVPGLTRTILPKARPDTLLASLAIEAEEDSSASSVQASLVYSQAVPIGTDLIQLGAFSTAEIAADEWSRLSQLYPAYLGNKTRVILEASSGGVSFYRLRAMGFSGADEARRLCSAFLTQNVECTPVSMR
ncbi:MAG: SPOR domain-containing protein [Marivivens sp.]|nr:SPOR domain-containing protein [Marivivens sp.]